MPHDLTPCPCGDTPELSLSEHRQQVREALQQQLASVGDTPPARGPARRDYELGQRDLERLQGDTYDVRCGNCGRWVHADTEEQAAVRWNKAVDRLAHLQECCKAATDRRADADSMVLLVCDSPDHDDTIHGRRYLPLEPGKLFDVKPSDAEDDAPRHLA
jgi:hypothetical protein